MISKQPSTFLRSSLLILSLSFFAFAAGEVDTSFIATVTNSASASVKAIVPQPDGKMLVGGSFRSIGGSVRAGMARLNADGTVDPSFLTADFYDSFFRIGREINAIALQPDGKILVGGNFVGVGFTQANGLIRLNPDGSIDATFSPPVPPNTVVNDIVILADGDILIAGTFTIAGPGGNRNGIARLNSNGSLDSIVFANFENINKLLVQSDGKILAASNANVRRFNPEGSLDSGFSAIVASSIIFTIHLQDDGKILVGGAFFQINGSSVSAGLVRANSNGTIDATFNPAGGGISGGAVVGITPAGGGNLIVYGGFQTFNGVAKKAVMVNSNGSVDPSFSFTAHPFGTIWDVQLLPDGKFLVGGEVSAEFAANNLFRVNSNGTVDSTLNLIVSTGASGTSLIVQPDNKIVLAGIFNRANGVLRTSLTRFNPDGSLDTTFETDLYSPTVGLNAVDLQPDGKILLTRVGSGPNRLHPNGSLDVFYSFLGTSYDIKSLPDGKVMISGQAGVRRYTAGGGSDATFPVVGAADVLRLALQPDGKTIIAGAFTQVNGTSRNRIARLNANGTIDDTFFGSANGSINAVAIQPDGKILIGGGFTQFNEDTNKKYLARLNSNGSLDASFAPILDAPVLAFKLQPNGKILIGGAMSSVNGISRRGIARLNTDGTLDATFDPGTGTNGAVLSIDLQSDGKVVYAGQFTRTNGIATLGIGRLLNPAPPRSTLFDFDGDGRSDISVFRSSTNRWYEALSTGPTVEELFGTAGDVIAPADFDGDGKTDEAIFRPSNGQWWYKSSVNGGLILNPFGGPGDIPRPSDFDGDGKADLVLFRPSTNTWFRFSSLTNQEAAPTVFGQAGDQPMVGDFDGDGKSDLAIFRPSNGDWWYAASSAGGAFRNVHWGQTGDIPVPADYDGDSKTDYAVFRPSDGGWYIYNSGNGSFTTTAFGISGDRPVAADYDGDGRADIAVFRPSTGIWYLLRSTAGFAGYQFGISTDTAIPSAFIP